MNKLFKFSAIAAGLVASGMAFADTSETKGGIKIKTDDGRFEANIGGRIHFDGNLADEDSSAGFGSALTPAQSGFYFRRIYLTLSGKLYGWKYKIENDFANGNKDGAASNAFQDVWMGTDIGPGELQIGQRKPFRAMEDLTSSNDILMIERPFASASGGMLKGGSEREFQDGVFYHGNGDQYTWGVGFYSLRSLNQVATEGFGESARGTFTPINEDGSIVHLGLSVSGEHPANNQSTNAAAFPVGAGSFAYAGRRGPTFNLGTTTGNLQTYGLEYANVFGPFFAQAEYMYQNQQVGGVTPNAQQQKVTAYYVQASVFVTGESKPYKKADGVFGNPKPNNDFGAVELTARYDMAKSGAGYVGSSCTAATDTKCQVSAVTLGTNYYVNPNVRFMLNYVMGRADRGPVRDQPNVIAARAQLSF